MGAAMGAIWERLASTSRSILQDGARARWALLALMGVVLLVGAAAYYGKIHSDKRTNRSAIQRWQPQILGLEQGEDISQKYAYPNPPIMSVLLLPLAKMPASAMAITWYLLKVGMAVLSTAWILAMVDPQKRLPWWAQGLAILLAIRPIIGDLQHGNVNLFVFFIVVGGLRLAIAGWSFSSGIALALAVSCKVTPLLFVPYFLWKRDWRLLAGWTVGMGLFLYPGIVPALYLGWDENQRNLASWYREMVHPFLVEGKVTSEHPNQSIPGLVFRLLTESPSFVVYPDGVFTPSEYHNFAALSPVVAKRLVQLCMLAFVAAVVFCCRNPLAASRNGAGGNRYLAAEFGLICIGMLLFSERTWKHHAVTLALPWAVWAGALATATSWQVRAGWISLAVVAQISLWATSTGLLDDRTAKLGQVYGGYTWAFILLAMGMAVTAWQGRKQPQGKSGEEEPGLRLAA